MVEHPAYKEIIATGPVVLRLIFAELKIEPRYGSRHSARSREKIRFPPRTAALSAR